MVLHPCVKWHGGKHRLARWIGERLPPNKIYLEPFGGPASVLLNRPRSKTEVYCDLDPGMVALMLAIRDYPDALQHCLRRLPFTLDTYRHHQRLCRQDQGVLEKAVSHFVLGRMGFGGGRWGGGYSYSPIVQNGWESSIDRLSHIHDRLQGVTICCRDGIDLLEEFSRTDVSAYCDPPYYPTTRFCTRNYTCEMDHEDHERLAAVAHRSRAKVAISGYPCREYHHWYGQWSQSSREVTKSMSPAKSKATEVLWMNYNLEGGFTWNC